MMWQVPVLIMTAQAFLLNVGLSATSDRFGRVLALVLATLSGLLGMQLMAKQRFHEQIDSKYLQSWEHTKDLAFVSGFTPHDHALGSTNSFGSTKAAALGVRTSPWIRLSSYSCWMWGLRSFVLAAGIVLLRLLTDR